MIEYLQQLDYKFYTFWKKIIALITLDVTKK